MPDSSPAGKPVLALTWEHHRRMNELCGWLGLDLQTLITPHRGARRYLALGARTLGLLWRARPHTVFIQNPSLILATLALAARPFCGRYRLIVDAHNEAVTPFTYARWPITWLARRALRLADVTVVTNAALASIVESAGGRPLVLPDRLPTAPIPPRDLALGETLEVMVVATYAADEPISAILEAARALGPHYRFSFTGNPGKLAPEVRAGVSANVHFTGFLPEHDYWEQMARSHAVLDLTLKPNCLVCGAYEALALARPMILTGNPATRDLFSSVALFPQDHDAASIAATVSQLRERYAELVARMPAAGGEFANRWLAAAQKLRASLAH